MDGTQGDDELVEPSARWTKRGLEFRTVWVQIPPSQLYFSLFRGQWNKELVDVISLLVHSKLLPSDVIFNSEVIQTPFTFFFWVCIMLYKHVAFFPILISDFIPILSFFFSPVIINIFYFHDLIFHLPKGDLDRSNERPIRKKLHNDAGKLVY